MVVASPQHRFSAMGAVQLAELAAEPLVHYDLGNGFGGGVYWVVTQRGIMLPLQAVAPARVPERWAGRAVEEVRSAPTTRWRTLPPP